MADAFTDTAALPYDQSAYDRMAYWPLRDELYFEQCADVRPTRQSMPGHTVVFSIQNDLAAQTTELTETADVDAIALSASQVSVVLKEQGAAVLTTAKVRATSYVEIDPIVANAVGYNAGLSIDTIVRDVLVTGANVTYGGGVADRVSVDATDIATAADFRLIYARLTAANVPKINGYYVAYIHPDIAHDIRAETGAAAWRDPHVYSRPEEIMTGELGEFEGFRFVVTPRAPLWADGGLGGTVDVYGTIIHGRQGLAKAHSTMDGNGANPRIVIGPQTDKLRRFKPVGWYHLVGYGIFREASLWRLETASSIGDNA